MIAKEDEKKEGKDEKLLADLCECYIFLSYNFPPSLLSFCVRCLIKVALNKEENEEAQKEVEMALLALSHIDGYYKIEKELYLNEIKEIIQYHLEHHNLTHLAYQSAWQFLLRRLEMDTANELHLAREAARELEELSKCLDWKRKEEKKGKETKEEKIINRWLQALFNFLCYCNMWNEEFIGLIGSIVEVYRAAKDNYRNICERCIIFLRKAAICESVKTDYLVKGGAINVALEEIQQPTTDDTMIHESLSFFVAIPLRMKEEKEDGIDEAKRKKNKIKLFEKLEEEGYEDSIASFYETLEYYQRYYEIGLSLNIADYFVNV
ncbi:uncharacterized protein MONOS_4021 [Monocercomonoides exilis]|uniref:uncharacterized protein n=1 Tax=Monocercomonoides exilis TaxID=2049356 RepID=UPI00355A213A|nr:hypothetical protein MONOS_4021 [Monocercomonoides exilis]|eukprot:MONOS_4021.1-p1 / transcript=MONOS_4021.1 / gene=MONOS_4021 / organism=Monocercomonoides_exilis_PA203 / gene_product=unspecified product / transcript_product=unspecified product / location=Mono_scaffold00101:100899-101925(+) / protein_length=322 / sequence_SO=supercontig / SO=protein_coding / is_pseudo=false